MKLAGRDGIALWYRAVRRVWIGVRGVFWARPRMAFGINPLSEQWGMDRGLPIHRYYVAQFLNAHRADIRGICLEFEDRVYADWFGGPALTRVEVLHADRHNPKATIVADLTKPNQLASDQFDCIICTHVLHLIPEPQQFVRELFRLIKPHGVLLLTVPHVSMCDPRVGERWRFTCEGLRQILTCVFGETHVSVEAFGNSLTAAGEIRGLVANEFRRAELNRHDERFAVEICARAVKAL